MKFRELFNDDWSVNWEKLTTIDEFEKLMITPQSNVWHKEGNCFKHTQLVTQAMERLLGRNLVKKDSDDWVMCMAAAICHDLGKAESTKWSDESNDWVTKNHAFASEKITRSLFSDEDILLREMVCYMVRYHMTLHHVYDKQQQTDKKLIRLSHGIVPIKYMILLNIADSLGSFNDFETEETISEKEMRLTNDASTLYCYQEPYSLVDKSQLIRDFIDYNGDVVNTTNDFCVYILCGFPGCGKSTYYNKFLSDKPIVSRDIIRGALGIGGATPTNGKKVVGTKEEEDKVSEMFNRIMIEHCENKESFVIDNTNLKYQYRKEYLLKIMKYNPLVKIVYIEAPDFLNDCIERRKGEISENVYERMLNGFEFPQLYECNQLLIYKEHTGREDEIHEFGESIVSSVENIPLKTKFLNDLKITRGAMILDGYDCYDSCVKYMNELIEKYERNDKI